MIYIVYNLVKVKFIFIIQQINVLMIAHKIWCYYLILMNAIKANNVQVN